MDPSSDRGERPVGNEGKSPLTPSELVSRSNFEGLQGSNLCSIPTSVKLRAMSTEEAQQKIFEIAGGIERGTGTAVRAGETGCGECAEVEATMSALVAHVEQSIEFALGLGEFLERGPREMYVAKSIFLDALAQARTPVPAATKWVAGAVARWADAESDLAPRITLRNREVVLVDPRAATIHYCTALRGEALALVPHLLAVFERLPDLDPVAEDLAEALIHIGFDRTEGMVPFLIEGLSSSSEKVRCRSAGLLGEFGMRAEPALEALTSALEDESPDVQEAAIASLGRLRMKASSVVPRLLSRIDAGDATLLDTTLVALARIGTHRKAVLDRLVGYWPGVKEEAQESDPDAEEFDGHSSAEYDEEGLADESFDFEGPSPLAFCCALAALSSYEPGARELFREAWELECPALTIELIEALWEIDRFEIAQTFFELVFTHYPDLAPDVLSAIARHGERGDELLTLWRHRSRALAEDADSGDERMTYRIIEREIDGTLISRDTVGFRAQLL